MISRTASRRRRSLLLSSGNSGAAPGPAEPWQDLEDSESPAQVDTGSFDATALDDTESMPSAESSPTVVPGTDRQEDAPGEPLVPELLLPVAIGQPFELTVEGPGFSEGSQVRIDEASVLVGRGPQCDVVLNHADVSRRHMLLQRVGNRLLFVDLCSRKGVLRNGDRQSIGWLGAGDELRIGPFLIRCETDGDESSSPAYDAPPERLFSRQPIPPSVASGLALRIGGEHGGRSIDVPLERPITLAGRASQCKLRLRDGSVSRMHAGFLLTPGGVFAIDLERRDGLDLNGRRVRRSELRVGDSLKIGRYRVQLIARGGGSELSSALAHDEPLIVTDEQESTLTVSHRVPDEQGSTLTVPMPTALTEPSSPGVPESVALALVGALADLQRQFHEQSRQQMEMMLRLAETVRSELRDEILTEMRELRRITAELQEAQQRAAVTAPEPMAKAEPSEGETAAPEVERPADAQTEEPQPPENKAPVAAEPAVSEPAVTERPKPAPKPRTRTGPPVGDAMWIAQRVAELQRERTSRWERLMKLIGGAG